MTPDPWRDFAAELANWRSAGRAVEFWWRDDDASRPDAALERLLSLGALADVPLALAVIPAAAQRNLFTGLGPRVTVLQHGTDHRNRAAPGEKKTEFAAEEPPSAAIARLAAARRQLEALALARSIPVLAPPWNRFPRALARALAAQGFRGLSQYGPRRDASPAAGLTQVNTHVDLIDWQGTRGFVGDDIALRQAIRHLAAKRSGTADSREPTGWLTHHACHDDACWAFLGRLFEMTASEPGVNWLGAREIFRLV